MGEGREEIAEDQGRTFDNEMAVQPAAGTCQFSLLMREGREVR
jgi:hypothetical protein